MWTNAVFGFRYNIPEHSQSERIRSKGANATSSVSDLVNGLVVFRNIWPVSSSLEGWR
ncbi:hypothetical protein Bra1253DRAFT_05931 [Bradyrhizobium sp. WSM1253]|nr:hypothetical protein Bra1253DRAFT_05931 [Bradyrhizobium sp. WSM1253]